MTTIDTSLLYSSVQAKSREVKNTLGKDDFLKLLITQLQHQDPTNPMQDTDYIAQMATFSELEQMSNMSKAMEEFVEGQQQNQMVAYSQFVGKKITYHQVVEGTAENDQPTIVEGNGIVSSIKFKEGTVQFVLEDGTKLSPANVSSVHDLPAANRLSEASHLIGKRITWMAEGEKEKTATVTSASIKNGLIQLEVNDDLHSKLSLEDIIKIVND